MNAKCAFIFLVGLLLSSCQSREKLLKQSIEKELAGAKGKFAVAFEDLQTGKQVLINEHESFHAASTMKTPVMIEVYKQVAAGMISLDDSITIRNEFRSIADGSTYSLSPEDDSELELYKHLGEKRTVYSLLYDMIIVSSNLATNIIIELVDARNVMKTMRGLGAKDIQVLRGVEDNKAFRRGMNNTTTASDLMLLFNKLGKGELVSKKDSDAMIEILLDQRFKSIIPARLPKDVRVAHKTGFITGIHHDSGLVLLPDGRRYTLVLLSRELVDEQEGINALAKVSERVYEYMISR